MTIFVKTLLLAGATLGTLAVPALADQAAADKCAAGLGDEAKAIYAAAAPQFASAADPKALVADTTKGLVRSGTVSMGSARSSAEAAGGCLMKLR